MPKIAFVGAGSLGFTRTLVIDMMSYEDLAESTISLIDIDAERLDYVRRAVEKIMEVGRYQAKVEASTDRAVGLKDADIVVITILAHGVEGFRPEIEIPMKYGVDFNVGDSYGTAAVFRSLRTIPQMLDIARDVEKYAPNAFILNYTNPMTMLCRALFRETSVQMVGLCHSVQGLARRLAKWIDIPGEEVVWEAAGINHQAWLLRFERNGENLYPRLRKAVEKPEVWEQDIVRNEMFKALGYYVTESSGHNSEYNWWFRKRPDLIEKYCTHGKDWNPGVHAYILQEYAEAAGTWKQRLEDYAEGRVEIKLGRSEEYASKIVRGLLFDETFKFNGNIPNTSLITNLPQDCVVEVPVIADKTGFKGVHVGDLPAQLVALNHITTMVSELTVEAALTGDPVAAYHACCYDPLAAAKLSLAEIKDMVDELFKAQAPLLPQFKHLSQLSKTEQTREPFIHEGLPFRICHSAGNGRRGTCAAREPRRVPEKMPCHRRGEEHVSNLPQEEAQRLLAMDEQLHAEADRMLAESGLGEIIAEAGYESVGSYSMRTMTWRDLDFERFQEPPDWGDHWDFGRKLAETGWPWRQVCVDSYRDPRDPRGNSFYWGLRVSFPTDGPTWKLDLHTARASDFTSGRALRSAWLRKLTDEARLHILSLKDAVWDLPEYRRTLLSVHIYEAVLDHRIHGLDAFMDWWRGRENNGA